MVVAVVVVVVATTIHVSGTQVKEYEGSPFGSYPQVILVYLQEEKEERVCELHALHYHCVH